MRQFGLQRRKKFAQFSCRTWFVNPLHERRRRIERILEFIHYGEILGLAPHEFCRLPTSQNIGAPQKNLITKIDLLSAPLISECCGSGDHLLQACELHDSLIDRPDDIIARGLLEGEMSLRNKVREIGGGQQQAADQSR